MTIDDINKKINFLKKALQGGILVLEINHENLTDSAREKYIKDNEKIKAEIEMYATRKQNIIRNQKIKKIINGQS
jgi:hypothetical protein